MRAPSRWVGFFLLLPPLLLLLPFFFKTCLQSAARAQRASCRTNDGAQQERVQNRVFWLLRLLQLVFSSQTTLHRAPKAAVRGVPVRPGGRRAAKVPRYPPLLREEFLGAFSDKVWGKLDRGWLEVLSAGFPFLRC